MNADIHGFIASSKVLSRLSQQRNGLDSSDVAKLIKPYRNLVTIQKLVLVSLELQSTEHFRLMRSA